MSTVRAFIAFPLPPEVIAHIRQIQAGIRAHDFPLRWVRPENIHLTLKFLGDTEQSAIGEIAGAMAETVRDTEPLTLEARGLGVFPGVRKPRVLWAGLAGETEALIRLQGRLADKLADLGFPRESRPFRAHLTLARTKGRTEARRLVQAMSEFGALASPPFATDEMVLYRSDLRPAGAVYTRLESVSLGAAP